MKKHTHIYEKVITLALAFALIVGSWSVMKIDARAAAKYTFGTDLTVGQVVNIGDYIAFPAPSREGIAIIWTLMNPEMKVIKTGPLVWDYIGREPSIPVENPDGFTYDRYKVEGCRLNPDTGDYEKIYIVELVAIENEEITPPEKSDPNTTNQSNTSQSTNGQTTPNIHTCNYEWVITLDPTTGADGLEEYKCMGCGVVKESHPIPASVAVVKDFYGKVKEAPEKGSITYDAGKLYTISDYILKKMAERNDVAVTVKFEYQNKKYQLIFPAGLDYSAVLNDEESMYGYFGAAAKLGLKVTEQ